MTRCHGGASSRMWRPPSVPKTMLAGLLSITTTGLLSPTAPAHAMASDGASLQSAGERFDGASLAVDASEAKVPGKGELGVAGAYDLGDRLNGDAANAMGGTP
ncbi:MAG: hypothetical protein Q4B54_14220, partial [Coriobacteriales bacterium]|nr:hypothetical protein [Coriobacteriales bacterium]